MIMKGEERKKRKKVKEIHINHNVWKKYHKGYMKRIIIKKKKTYISSKDPKEFEGTEMDNLWLKIDNKKKTFI